MSRVNFTVLSKRGEKALSLTRSARGLDREKAREIGETAAQILRGIVRELRGRRAMRVSPDPHGVGQNVD